MRLQAFLAALCLSTLASCDKNEPGVDAGQVERCCVRGSTKTLRFECEPGETAFIASACTEQPDSGVAEPSVISCGDGKLDPTDECEGSSGCSSGSCTNCACVAACPTAPVPNPQLLCSTNADCPEGNGQCFACRCAQNATVVIEDAMGDAPVDFDFQRLTVQFAVASQSTAIQVLPAAGERICMVEFRGSALVAQVCFFLEESAMAEYTSPTGSRLLIPGDEYSADLGLGVFGAKRSVLPLASGDSIFVYNAAKAAPRVIVDRVPDKGGFPVDRLLGAN